MGCSSSAQFKSRRSFDDRNLFRWLDPQYADAKQMKIRQPGELERDLPFPSQTLDKTILNRIHGSLLGLAIGDALGAPFEFRPYQYMKAKQVKDLCCGGTWGLDKGQFTDDTTMALCLAASLIVCRDFQPYDQLVRYKWWYRLGYMSSTGECFDIGAGTKNALERFERRQDVWAQENGIPLAQIDLRRDSKILDEFDVYCSDKKAAGNGGLMRLAPVPLFFYEDPIRAVQYSGISAEITHGDPRARDACRYYGALIVAALHGETKEELLDGSFYERHQTWFGSEELHSEVLQIVRGSYRKKSKGYESGIRGKGFVLDSLEAALWAFASDEGSFEIGALAAVNLGDDADTTAAIYGQLVGAYYGYDQLPARWRNVIYAKRFLSCLSSWLAQRGHEWFRRQSEWDEEPVDTGTESTQI